MLIKQFEYSVNTQEVKIKNTKSKQQLRIKELNLWGAIFLAMELDFQVISSLIGYSNKLFELKVKTVLEILTVRKIHIITIYC